MTGTAIRETLADHPDTVFVIQLRRTGRGGTEITTRLKSVQGRQVTTVQGDTFDIRSVRLAPKTEQPLHAEDLLNKAGGDLDTLLDFIDQEGNIEDVLCEWIDDGGQECVERFRQFLAERS